MIDMIMICSRNNIFDLIGVRFGDGMLANLFVWQRQVMDTSGVCGLIASSMLAEAQVVDCIIKNASKIQKPAPIKNIHSSLFDTRPFFYSILFFFEKTIISDNIPIIISKIDVDECANVAYACPSTSVTPNFVIPIATIR